MQASDVNPPVHVEMKYKSRIAAALLAMMGGSFGLHRFFLGQWWGVAYLLFCWTLIPAVIGFIEGIVFLVSDQQQWNNKYNQGRQLGSESGGVLVALLLLPLMGLPMLGVLAAIALPAYQTYTLKANAAMGHSQAQLVKQQVATYVAKYHDLPKDNEALGVDRYLDSPVIALLDVYNGRIRVEFTPSSKVEGSLIYQVDVVGDQLVWDCRSSTVKPDYLPKECW